MPNSWMLRSSVGALLLVAASGAPPLHAQGAIDPSVTPRAAALERQGERQVATDMLGRYLAVAQSDGKAWFLLSRFYRQDAADWHRSGHDGSPGADLYLSLANVAASEAYNLNVDSALVLRALLAMDRAVLVLEDSGWSAARSSDPEAFDVLPGPVAELGRNLVASCPAGGVVVPGSDFEQLAVWYGIVRVGGRADLIAVRPDLYVTDARYQRRMASLLGADPALGLREALAVASASRAICLPPSMDASVLVEAPIRPMRLLRVTGPGDEPAGIVLSLTEVTLDARTGPSLWTREVLSEYAAAARHNDVLCRSLAAIGGNLPGNACRP